MEHRIKKWERHAFVYYFILDGTNLCRSLKVNVTTMQSCTKKLYSLGLTSPEMRITGSNVKYNPPHPFLCQLAPIFQDGMFQETGLMYVNVAFHALVHLLRLQALVTALECWYGT
jgi:hypothetical protein